MENSALAKSLSNSVPLKAVIQLGQEHAYVPNKYWTVPVRIVPERNADKHIDPFMIVNFPENEDMVSYLVVPPVYCLFNLPGNFWPFASPSFFPLKSRDFYPSLKIRYTICKHYYTFYFATFFLVICPSPCQRPPPPFPPLLL